MNTWDDLRQSHVEYGYVPRDPFEFIIQNHRAFLQPAVSLKRIRYHTKDHMRVDTPTRQEFKQCQRIEYAKIWARVQRAQMLELRYESLGVRHIVAGNRRSRSASFDRGQCAGNLIYP
jgi:hypothetical protein